MALIADLGMGEKSGILAMKVEWAGANFTFLPILAMGSLGFFDTCFKERLWKTKIFSEIKSSPTVSPVTTVKLEVSSYPPGIYFHCYIALNIFFICERAFGETLCY